MNTHVRLFVGWLVFPSDSWLVGLLQFIKNFHFYAPIGAHILKITTRMVLLFLSSSRLLANLKV